MPALGRCWHVPFNFRLYKYRREFILNKCKTGIIETITRLCLKSIRFPHIKQSRTTNINR